MKPSDRLSRLFGGALAQEAVRMPRTQERGAMMSALQITAP